MKIQENVPISEITTMRIGGNARYLIDVFAKDEIIDAFKFIDENKLKFFFLGEGANSIG